MESPYWSVLAVLIIVSGPFVGLVGGSEFQLRQSVDRENGLLPNESATLWSRDNDSGYITNAEYREAYGESRSAMAELANASDITFTHPPETASTWSEHAHQDFEAGDVGTSVAPRGGQRTDGRLISDAHASIFSISPATYLHKSTGETTLYVAPKGTVRGVIDYRLALENATNRSDVVDHRIDEVRLLADGAVVARAEGSHRPVLDYELPGRPEHLTLEADITAQVERPVAANQSNRSSNIVEETVTVRETRAISVYQLNPTLRTVRYPNDDIGVAVSQIEPWRGYAFGEDGERVRSVWRFYTARDTDWDELTARNATGVSEYDSSVRPVAVHAYPSELGPQARSTGGSIDLVETWGTTNSPPILDENVLAEVVDQPYESTWGIETRQGTVSQQVSVDGIVRGVNTTLAVNGTEQTLQESSLSLEVLESGDENVTLLATLRDADSGEPLHLGEYSSAPTGPGGDSTRGGYLTVAGQSVGTNESGMAVVAVSDAGVYSAEYHPESWLRQPEAYTPPRASTRWHPLTDPSGWLWLAVDGLVWLSPFLLALLAGRTLSRLVSGSRYT